jgi:putative transposase
MPSYTTARRFLMRYEANHYDVVVLKREGEKALRDKVLPYIKRDPTVLKVGDVLFADGHKLNFDSLHPVTGKPARMTLIVWFDWSSRMPVGWEIMPEETTLAISSALRMGITNLGKLPKCVYIDNGKAFRAKYFSEATDFQELDGLYHRLGIAVQYSKPYAAQTKIVERFWGTFNEQCARLLPSYRGNCIDDKPAYLKRAENYHKQKHCDVVPTLQDTAQIFAKYVNWYAHNEHMGLGRATPWSVFEPGRGPGVDTEELDRAFLLRKRVKPNRAGFVIAGIRFESDALYGLSKDVLALYSWADMSEVNLVDIESGDAVGKAYPVESLNPLAKHFGDALDMQKVAEANKRQQQLRRGTLEMARLSDGNNEALMSMPWMLPATERRTPIELPQPKKETLAALCPITGSSASRDPVTIPALSESETTALQAVSEQLKAKKINFPAYESPDYFGSERERYEFLFALAVIQNVDLTDEDTAFMRSYEQNPDFSYSAKRFENLREFYSRAKPDNGYVGEDAAYP